MSIYNPTFRVYNVLTRQGQQALQQPSKPKALTNFNPYTCDQATMSSGIGKKMIRGLQINN